MSEGWRQFDLEGEGLQAVNRRIVAQRRRRGRAYGFWAFFPLGLHRDYLDAHGTAWCWRAASVAAIAALWSGAHWEAAAIAAAMLGVAVYDLFWIDRRVTALNKALRKDAYLSKSTPGAPSGFRGRLGEDSASAAGAHASDRVPSFAEQERLLRDIAARRRGPSTPRE